MKSMKSVKAFLFCVAAVLTVAFAVAVSKPYNNVSTGLGQNTYNPDFNTVLTEDTANFYDTSDLSESAQSATEEDSINSESENETGFTVASNDEANTKSAATQNTEKSTVKSATIAPSTTKKSVASTTQKETTTRKPTTTAPVQAEENEQMTVYYTKTGERYHYANSCGRGKYYPTTLAEAKKMGLTPCQKCVLH